MEYEQGLNICFTAPNFLLLKFHVGSILHRRDNTDYFSRIPLEFKIFSSGTTFGRGPTGARRNRMDPRPFILNTLE